MTLRNRTHEKNVVLKGPKNISHKNKNLVEDSKNPVLLLWFVPIVVSRNWGCNWVYSFPRKKHFKNSCHHVTTRGLVPVHYDPGIFSFGLSQFIWIRIRLNFVFIFGWCVNVDIDVVSLQRSL